jgi:hypothetical protein
LMPTRATRRRHSATIHLLPPRRLRRSRWRHTHEPSDEVFRSDAATCFAPR